MLLTVWLAPAAQLDAAHNRPSWRSFLGGIGAALLVVLPAVLIVVPLWLRNVTIYGGWDFLEPHAYAVMRRIRNPEIAALHIMEV